MGSDFFESLKDLPNSTRSLMFRSLSVAHLPRSLRCRHVGYAVEPIIISSDATRSTHTNARRRYSHPRTRHRHPHTHCCNPDRAHGLGRLCLSPAKVIYFFLIYAKNKKNRPPQAVFIPLQRVDFFDLRFTQFRLSLYISLRSTL